MGRQSASKGRGRGRSGGRGGRGGRGSKGGRDTNSPRQKASPQQTTLFSNATKKITYKDKEKQIVTTGQTDKNADTSKIESTRKTASKIEGVKELDDDDEYHDDDDESGEIEDDLNTINSDETSKRGRSTLNKKVPPKFIRYQMMVKMDESNKDSPIQIDKMQEEKSPSQRLRDILATFHAQMKTYDSKSRLISWKSSPDFLQLKDTFPTDIAEVAIYFNGHRANINPEKRIYLRLCIHTPNSDSKLYQKLHSWCTLYGYSLNRCIIQAENSTCVGWLCYSSQYTDTEPLKRRLLNESNFEWGFKLIAVDEKQNKKPWLERTKAVGVFVPTAVKDIAMQIIGEELEAELNDPIAIPDFTDKFLFIEPQWTTKGTKSRELYYEDMLDRHESHLEDLRAEVSYGIKVDLDKSFNFYESFSISLRDIILDLCVGDKRNDFHGDRLFHSVDYRSDSSNLWIDKKNGPGGPCVVFTYYADVVSEASTMIKGLGKFIVHQYNKELAAKMFHADHFRANRGYRWNENLQKFSTPNIRRMISNVEKDHNLSAIKKIQRKRKLRMEREQTEAEEGLTKESLLPGAMLIKEGDEETEDGEDTQVQEDNESEPTRTYEDIKKVKFKKMREGVRDSDLVSVNDEGSTNRNNPNTVIFNDTNSVNSSLTANTNNSMETIESQISGSTFGTSNVTLSKPSILIDMYMIEEIATGTEAISDEELRRQVKAMQAHKYNDAIVNTQKLVENYISSRNTLQTPTSITTGKHRKNSINKPNNEVILSTNAVDTPSDQEVRKKAVISLPPMTSTRSNMETRKTITPAKKQGQSNMNKDKNSPQTDSISLDFKAITTNSSVKDKKSKESSKSIVNTPVNQQNTQDSNPTKTSETKRNNDYVHTTTPTGTTNQDPKWSDIVKNGKQDKDLTGKLKSNQHGLSEIEKEIKSKADDDPPKQPLPSPTVLFDKDNSKQSLKQDPKEQLRRSKRTSKKLSGTSASNTGMLK